MANYEGKEQIPRTLDECLPRMADIEKARRVFQGARLAFPNLPVELAARLKERGEWLFSTREISSSPYDLGHYVRESKVSDYAILSHSGHGVNSYAIQYYLVYRALRMFLHLGWGGVYMDEKADASKIHDCFALADDIVPRAQTVGLVPPGNQLTIVGSDFYGSYWALSGEDRLDVAKGSKGPALVLAKALRWLQGAVV